MKQTVIYARQSLEKDKQPYSIEMQISTCKEYARDKSWVIHNIFDEGTCSARKTQIRKRPVLVELLERIKEGSIGRVIVFKRDRLARNVEQYLSIFKEFKEAGVELCFSASNEPPISRGPIGEFIEALLAGIAEYEGENIVKRLSISKRSRSKAGKWVGGRPRVGYLSKEGSLSVNPKKINFVKAIFSEFINTEGADLEEITKKMKTNTELKGHQFDLQKIISNPIYKGDLVQQIDGEVYRYPEKLSDELILIDDDQWEVANKKLELFGPFNEEDEEEEEKYVPLLSNIVICAKCKKPLKTGSRLYSCKECTTNKNNIQILDRHVLKEVLKHIEKKALKNKQKIIEVLKTHFLKEPSKKVKCLEKKQIEIEKKIQDIMRAYDTGGYKDKYIKDLVQDLKDNYREFELVNKKIMQINKTILAFDGADYSLKVDQLSDSEKYNLVGLIQSVFVYRSNVRTKFISKKPAKRRENK